ncbi:uncharacterized protein Tco025E_00052 [Trypanosoma conorhini]|uniref:Uncharacterized protein n=1 Tax=Trypanosoma conorhini TaxID=83891 RepID=A0A422QCH0_9TRYP|nr:uncharacterized protein Tco025E_00052 [Trypanosoma conorhini]RNF27668.1 hypothetical protein Tco025E_00052 [Trypanosoma conorhini]
METQCFHVISVFLQKELEDRCDIYEEEQGRRYSIALLANSAMVRFHRECETAFLLSQNALIENLDKIATLQKQISDINEENAISTGTDVSGGCNDGTERNFVEDTDDNESLNEMKKLLTECWVVLGQDT